MEHLLLYDTFVIGSLQVIPQSDCLPVPPLTVKPNDGELGLFSQVRSFNHLKTPQDDDFELLVFVPKLFFILLLFCTIRNKVQYDK